MRLASYAGNRAMARVLARNPSPAAPPVATETVAVKMRWDQTEPPRKYLKDAFDDHPVDWKADVYVDGKRSAAVTARSRSSSSRAPSTTCGSSRRPRRATTTTTCRSVTKKARRRHVDVKLVYNRSNQWFTDESWEKVGIDPAKAARHDRRRCWAE